MVTGRIVNFVQGKADVDESERRDWVSDYVMPRFDLVETRSAVAVCYEGFIIFCSIHVFVYGIFVEGSPLLERFRGIESC
jgi:hypothetical protein